MDQPSSLDTMTSTARTAQGLKDDEEVDKHITALYQTKPPNTDGFGDWKPPANFQMSQKMAMDTEELARRSAIYASLADNMVASVISELSPRDERTKLLKEKLVVIQEAQVAAMSSGFAATSNLQLLRRDALLKNFGFQPQVLSMVRTALFEGSHVVGLDPKVLQQCVRNIRHANRMSGSSVTFQKATKEATTSQVTKKTPKVKTQQARTSVFDRLGFISQPTIQRTITQDTQSFRAESGWGGRGRPNKSHRCKSSGATQAPAAGRR